MIPGTLFYLPALACHTRFDNQIVAIKSYASAQRIFSYSEISEIAVVEGRILKDGSFHADPHIVLSFHDGTKWTSRDNLRDPEAVNYGLVAFLETKTQAKALRKKTA